MRPEWCAGYCIDRLCRARYLIALSPAVLVHHRKDTMNLISISSIESQMSVRIGISIIVVGNRVRRVGKDVCNQGGKKANPGWCS
jgi:hypothetical protein